MMAVTPAAAARSGPSRNGKNASDARTEPAGPRARLLDGDSHRVEPAHLARADADDLAVLRQHDRVRLDRGADAPGECEVAPLGLGGRAPGRDGLPRPGPARAGPSLERAGLLRSGGSRTPRAWRRSGRSAPPGRPAGRCCASSVWSSAIRVRRRRNPGASIASRNRPGWHIRSAVARSTGRFKPTMPPKALTGSPS